MEFALESTLITAPSWIPNAGLGLFTSSFIPFDTVVCKYFGTNYPTAEAIRLGNKDYLMRLGEQVYVDSSNQLDCLARYINDCRNPLCYNVKFVKLPEEGCALVVTIRDIQPHEELFVDYGKWYWLSCKGTKLTFGEVNKKKVESGCPSNV